MIATIVAIASGSLFASLFAAMSATTLIETVRPATPGTISIVTLSADGQVREDRQLAA